MQVRSSGVEESKQEDDGADDRKRGDVDGIVKGQASPWDGLAGWKRSIGRCQWDVLGSHPRGGGARSG